MTFKKGLIPWNKGIKTGLVPKSAFKKGLVPWNKGKKMWLSPELHPSWKGGKAKCIDCGKELTQRKYKQCANCYNTNKKTETLEKLSTSHIGQMAWNKGKPSLQAKENHPNWKGGITPENRLLRNKFKDTVIKEVLKRDEYTCQLCGVKGEEMHIDHIQPWSEYVEGRFCIDNCRTLCRACHYQITFGKPMPKDSKWGKNYYAKKHIGSAYYGVANKFA